MNKREGQMGKSSLSWVENTNMTDFLQSINSDKHLPQIVVDDDIQLWCLYTVVNQSVSLHFKKLDKYSKIYFVPLKSYLHDLKRNVMLSYYCTVPKEVFLRSVIIFKVSLQCCTVSYVVHLQKRKEERCGSGIRCFFDPLNWYGTKIRIRVEHPRAQKQCQW